MATLSTKNHKNKIMKTKAPTEIVMQEKDPPKGIKDKTKETPPKGILKNKEVNKQTLGDKLCSLPKTKDLNPQSLFDLEYKYFEYGSPDKLMKDNLLQISLRAAHKTHDNLSRFIEKINSEKDWYPAFVVIVGHKLRVLDFATILKSDLLKT